MSIYWLSVSLNSEVKPEPLDDDDVVLYIYVYLFVYQILFSVWSTRRSIEKYLDVI